MRHPNTKKANTSLRLLALFWLGNLDSNQD